MPFPIPCYDKSIVQRMLRVKRATLRFLCPLCGIERGLQYHSTLRPRHYLQILLIALILGLLLWPLIKWKAIYPSILIWGSYELISKLLYRKDIPCPHCGFDASWYKRNIQMARKIVQNFWAKKHSTQ